MREQAKPTRTSRLEVAIIAVLVVLALPANAVASSGPWQSMDITLIQGQQGQPVLLVAGELPTGAKLPAKTSLAVPAGAKILWTGEILGGDPSKDPPVKYTVKTGTDYDLAEFTLTTSRIGQIEVDAPGAIASSGGGTQASLDWVAPYDISSATLSVLLPGGAQVTSGTVGAKTTQDGAASFYRREVQGVKKGDSLRIAVAYTGGATSGGAAPTPVQPQPGGATSSGGGASPLLIIAVLGLIISVTLVLLKRVSGESSRARARDDGADR